MELRRHLAARDRRGQLDAGPPKSWTAGTVGALEFLGSWDAESWKMSYAASFAEVRSWRGRGLRDSPPRRTFLHCCQW